MTCQAISPNEVELRTRGGARLIDMRERDEYREGHIPGAVKLPWSEWVGREDEVASLAVLICASGHRSAHAAAHLAALGRTDLTNLTGGTAAWVREGRTLNGGEQP